MMVISPHSEKTQQKVAVSCVDDTDLGTDRELAEQNIQKMIDEYDHNYEATGGHVEIKKNIQRNGSGHKKIKR